ncbi:MAG TPA: alpha/beta hydrolase [Chthoniobacterales bacterium]|jgi:pimeloyl-ACP methyl ester carboxylesterase|nr:alpha/beta hydrolase [Chthoniobacterales bacterium]
MASFYRDGLQFNYATRGLGTNTLIFQHGIGGTLAQPFRFLIPSNADPNTDKEPVNHARQFRLAAFDFRAHGATPLGDPEKLRIDIFADDLVAFMDYLQIERAVLGGISMGAAVALSAASRYPERCVALVLCRPAWLNGSMSSQAVAAYAEAARLLKEEVSPASALQKLEKSDIYRSLITRSADAGKSLLGQIRCVVLDSNLREAAVARLQYLPTGQPGLDLQSAAAVRVPTLIMATPNDPIHPLSFAEALAGKMPRASLVKLGPKQLNDGPHIEEVNSRILQFLPSVLA